MWPGKPPEAKSFFSWAWEAARNILSFWKVRKRILKHNGKNDPVTEKEKSCTEDRKELQQHKYELHQFTQLCILVLV